MENLSVISIILLYPSIYIVFHCILHLRQYFLTSVEYGKPYGFWDQGLSLYKSSPFIYNISWIYMQSSADRFAFNCCVNC